MHICTQAQVTVGDRELDLPGEKNLDSFEPLKMGSENQDLAL